VVRLASLNEEAAGVAPSDAKKAIPLRDPELLPPGQRQDQGPDISETLPAIEPLVSRPRYIQDDSLPIDLVTVIRLVDSNSPAIGLAQARVQEAIARTRTAEVQWIPTLAATSIYNRFDGQTQNQRGEVFSVSRSNLLGGGNAAMTLDFSQAIYAPLVARRLQSAEQLRASAAMITAELDAVLAYLDVMQVEAQLRINDDTLQKAEQMLQAAINAQQARLDRSPGDVNRARAESLLRRQERLDLQGRSGAATARLGRLLLLDPNVRLMPQEPFITPITLIDEDASLDEMVSIAIDNRPDLAANRELLAAAWAAVRRAEHGPLLPKLIVQDQGGTFGGGLNADLQNFAGRNVINAQLYWELKNLGFGNRSEVAERRASADQAQFQLVETQARLTAEIVEAAQIAAAKFQAMEPARQAVREAEELYRINQEGTFNVVDGKNLFDALRPLQAIQILNQARNNYLAIIIEYNRAQFRLYSAMGRPPHCMPEPQPPDGN
jgi:outer membrane protein TolC